LNEVLNQKNRKEVTKREELQEWLTFFRSENYLLKDYPNLLFQQAANQPDNTPPAIKARSRIQNEIHVTPWVRWINKPQMSKPCVMVLTGHSHDITACRFTPDGSRIISGSLDRTLRVWDIQNGIQLSKFHILDRNGTVAFSPDCKIIASPQTWLGQNLNIYSVETGRVLKTIIAKGIVFSTFSPDGLHIYISSRTSWGGNSCIYDVNSGKSVKAIGWAKGGTGSYSPDKSLFVVAEEEHLGEIRLHDPITGRFIYKIDYHGKNKACAFSSCGKVVAWLSEDGILRLWRVKEKSHIECRFGYYATELERRLIKNYPGDSQGHTLKLTAFSFSPNGKWIATASDDSTIKLWKWRDGKHLSTLTGHTGSIKTCAFSSDSSLLVSGSIDKTLRIWDVEAAISQKRHLYHQDKVNNCSFSPDGNEIASVSQNGNLHLWNGQTGERTKTAKAHSVSANACVYHPNGTHLVTSGAANHIRPNLEKSAKRHYANKSNDFLVRKWLWERRQIPQLKVWSLKNGIKNVMMAKVQEKPSLGLVTWTIRRIISGIFYSIAMLSALGAIVGVAFGPIIIGLSWLLGKAPFQNFKKLFFTLSSIGPFLGPIYGLVPTLTLRRSVNSCTISPDGSNIIVGLHDGRIISMDRFGNYHRTYLRYNYGNLRQISQNFGWFIERFSMNKSQSVINCKFSFNGSRLFIGFEDGRLKIIDTKTGRLVYRASHPDQLICCALSSDGMFMASGGKKNKKGGLRLWNAMDLKQMSVLSSHDDLISAVAFSYDSSKLASASSDGTIRLWVTRTRKEIFTWKSNYSVTDLSWSPDGCLLAVGDTFGQVQLWSLKELNY